MTKPKNQAKTAPKKPAARRPAPAAKAPREASAAPVESPPAPAVRDPGKKFNNATVTVGCKIPAGLKLQCQRAEKYTEQTQTGPRDAVRWVPDGAVVILRGPSVSPMDPKYPRKDVVEGMALTHNVPADFMERWLEQNRRNPLVETGMIVVQDNRREGAAEARDRKDQRSNLEPLKPEGDPRVPKSQNPKVEDVATHEHDGRDAA